MPKEYEWKKVSEKIQNESIEQAKGTRYEKVLEGKDGKYKDGTPLEKKGNVWKATLELMKYEFGDKSFLIIFLFTLGWSNPMWAHQGGDDRPGYAVFADGHKFIQHRLTNVSPLRIFVLSFVGTFVSDWRNAGK